MAEDSSRCRFHGVRRAGFTVIELVVALCLMGIIGTIALPKILDWLPDMSLKAAARDLYSNLQRAKAQAVRTNQNVSVRFNSTVSPGFYYFDTNGDGVYTAGEFRVNLSDYGYGIDFGTGNALQNWNGNNCTQANVITFTGNGTANNASVYLDNRNNTICYAVTVIISGSIKLRKYSGSVPFNVNDWN